MTTAFTVCLVARKAELDKYGVGRTNGLNSRTPFVAQDHDQSAPTDTADGAGRRELGDTAHEVNEKFGARGCRSRVRRRSASRRCRGPRRAVT
jgi:hypothetical protein